MQAASGISRPPTRCLKGTHSFQATQTDLAGNSEDTLSGSFVVNVDTTPPGAPSIASFTPDTGSNTSDSLTSATSLTLSGTAENGSTVTILDGGSTAVGTGTADASTGAWTVVTTGALKDGTHTLTATATDAAGNSGSASTGISVTIDSTTSVAITSVAPDNGKSSSDHITSATTLTLTGTAEAGDSVTITDGTATVAVLTADGTGNWSTSTSFSGGTHTFVATATDAAGNTASSTFTMVVDTTPPVTSINSFTPNTGVTTDAITSATLIMLTGSTEASGTVTVFDGTSNLGTTTADGSGVWHFATSGTLSQTTHTFTASATDLAGNAGSTSAGFSVTVDTTKPGAPTISGFTPDTGVTGDKITSASTLTFTGTAEPNSTVTVLDNSTTIATGTADGSGNWSAVTTTQLSDGTHNKITATATDVAGNTGTASANFTLTEDTTGPVPIITGISPDTGDSFHNKDNITTATTFTLSGTTEASSTVTIYEGGNSLGSATVSANKWTFTTTVASDGSYTFTAKATDFTGNTGPASAALTVTVDHVAPGAPTINGFSPDTGVTGDFLTSATTLTLLGTAEANSTVSVFDGTSTKAVASVLADSSGNWSVASKLSAGSHSLTATATDGAGNTGTASGSFSVTIDTTAPSTPTVITVTPDTGSSSSDLVTSASTLTFSGSAEASSTVKIFDGTGTTAIATATADGSGNWTTSATFSEASHALTVTATDAAGNSSKAASLSLVVDQTPPAVSIISQTLAQDSGPSSTDLNTFNGSVTLTGTIEVGVGEIVTIKDGSASLGTATLDGSGGWTFSTVLGEGSHQLYATGTDLAGNTASTTLEPTITVTPPVKITSEVLAQDTGTSSTDFNTQNGKVTLKGTVDTGWTVEVWDGSTDLGSASISSGTWTFTTTLGEGTHVLFAKATDSSADVVSTPNAPTVTVDVTAPAAPTIATFTPNTGVTNDSLTNATSITLSGTAEAGTIVKVFDNSGTATITSATADSSGHWSAVVSSGNFAAASHSFTATATDLAGNTGSASTAFAVSVDRTAPSAPSITGFSPDNGVTGDSLTDMSIITLSGTAEALSTVKIFDGSGTTVIGTATADASGVWSAKTTGTLADGTHSFTATATDVAGNTGSTSSAFKVAIDTVSPTVTIIGDAGQRRSSPTT